MPLLTLAEAAIASGFSIELLEHLADKCPKPGEDRRLPCRDVDGVRMIDEKDLDEYRDYLREPWPFPRTGQRPRVPKHIADDVRAESHHECSICGAMDNGELAHIEPSSSTLNNSPDNLILLCPRHHTKYDLGVAPVSNVDKDVVLAAKKMKRASRRRMLKFEGNAAKALRTAMRTVKDLEEAAKAAKDSTLRQTFTTEIQSVLAALPAIASAAKEAAGRDGGSEDLESAVVALAPSIARAAQASSRSGHSDADVRSAAQELLRTSGVLLAIDEVECPHCHGAGQTGLVGDLCRYCGGSCVVTHEKAEDYDPEDLDEVDCPHCHGTGQTGLVGDMCRVCRGSCVLATDVARAYGDIRREPGL